MIGYMAIYKQLSCFQLIRYHIILYKLVDFKYFRIFSMLTGPGPIVLRGGCQQFWRLDRMSVQ